MPKINKPAPPGNGGKAARLTKDEAVKAVQVYRKRDLPVFPLGVGKKKADGAHPWQNSPETVTDENVAKLWANGENVGLRLDPPLTDVDLDCEETVRIAPRFLPPTPFMFGRGGKITHYFYECEEDAKSETFMDPVASEKKRNGDDAAKEMLVEIRHDNGYTLVPPSVHPSGEQLKFAPNEGWPEAVIFEDLHRRVQVIAACALMVRYWPGPGGRNHATLGLAGGLVQAEREKLIDPRAVDAVVKAIIEEGGNEDAASDFAAVERTRQSFAKRDAGGENKITGWLTLEKALGVQGKAVVAQFREWLGVLPARKAGGSRGSRGSQPSPRELARRLLDTRDPLLFYGGEWLSYDRGAYRTREKQMIRSEIYEAYDDMNSRDVSDVLDALMSIVIKDRNLMQPPCWLDGRAGPDPSKLLVLRNGILNLETGELTPPDPALLTLNALDFDFDPDAPEPARWLQFLEEVWPSGGYDDPGDDFEYDETPDQGDCHGALQKIFGYSLTPDTSQQAIPIIIGPPRSGKGTIARVLTKLLGAANVCSPTLASLSGDFGLQPLIGKQLAIISDMRVRARSNIAEGIQALLRISGEDSVSVNRKNATSWEGRLPTRFIIMSNEVPSISDSSGALMSRFRVLQIRRTFLGQEDRGLDDKLEAELPGILNWAIEGWRDLRRDGRLDQPESSASLVRRLKRATGPVHSFVMDECDLGPGLWVRKDDLMSAFKRWAEKEELNFRVTKSQFGEQLLSAFGARGVKGAKPRLGGKQRPVYVGLTLREGSGLGSLGGHANGETRGESDAGDEDDVPF